ncbi:MAG: S9 family peptidase, partial [Myxococcota bacterium]|nr:S9 family peptidase [Myxococcota bacterium]
MKPALLLLPLLLGPAALAAESEDPHLWLEDVTGEEALDWVRERNEVSVQALASDPEFEALEQRLLAAFDSDDRIPYVGERAGYYYNFWRDGEHARGIWRRTTLEQYRQDDPEWDVVLDLDALAETEEENWVWDGASCLPPAHDRCLVALSRGGADASVTREFDMPSRSFVEDGFFLPEAKGGASWIDRDTVFVRTDFGEGSLTDSGYPRLARRWTRGTPLDQAELVIEGETTDVSVGAYHDHTPGFERDLVYRNTSFYSDRVYLLEKSGLVEIEKPEDANISLWREWLLVELRSDWTHDGNTYTAGSLLVTPLKKWMKGKGRLEVLFEPTDRTSLAGFSPTRNHLLLNVLDNVRNRIEVLTPGRKGWTRGPLPGLPEFGTVGVWA